MGTATAVEFTTVMPWLESADEFAPLIGSRAPFDPAGDGRDAVGGERGRALRGGVGHAGGGGEEGEQGDEERG